MQAQYYIIPVGGCGLNSRTVFTILGCFFALWTRSCKSPKYRVKRRVTPPVHFRSNLAETPGQHERQHYEDSCAVQPDVH